MSIRKYTEPWTGDPREPDEFQHLINLEEDSRGGTIWPWIAGTITVIVLLTLVYGYSRKISTMAAADVIGGLLFTLPSEITSPFRRRDQAAHFHPALLLVPYEPSEAILLPRI